MYDKTIEAGMILCSRWSARGRDRDFFEVMSRSDTHVIIREIDSAADAAGDVVPFPGRYLGANLRRKLRHYHGQEFIFITGNNRALIHDEPLPALRLVPEMAEAGAPSPRQGFTRLPGRPAPRGGLWKNRISARKF
jgi:hypothetical protein